MATQLIDIPRETFPEELKLPFREESARVKLFQDDLREVCRTEVVEAEIDATEEEPVHNAIRRFETYQMPSQPTFFSNPNLGIIAGAKPIDLAPRVSRVGKKSRHGVFFGDLRFENDVVIPVAVKPHWDTPTLSCLQDYFNGVAVEGLGLETIKPVGFVLGGETAYSLTVLDESLTSLDSIDWSSFYPNITANPGMQRIMEQTAQLLAVMHSTGSTHHGDMAARNIATSAEGDIIFIDWESAHISLTKPRDAEVRFTHSNKDLSTLLESLCIPPHAGSKFNAGIGVFYGKEGDWWEGFCHMFFDEYITFRRECARVGKHAQTIVTEVESEIEVLEQTLRAKMEHYKKLCAAIQQLGSISQA